MRVISYVDGFNLYHAIDDLGDNHLKWVDLWALSERFAKRPRYDLRNVVYFTAFATWRPAAYKRHLQYVRALETKGVELVQGHFKKKERGCRSCGKRWIRHEEKETDVNIAVRLVTDAFRDRYDRALLISGDSDIVPAVAVVKHHFPEKSILVLAPPGRPWSRELVQASGDKRNLRALKRKHIAAALLPAILHGSSSSERIVRPTAYDPR